MNIVPRVEILNYPKPYKRYPYCARDFEVFTFRKLELNEVFRREVKETRKRMLWQKPEPVDEALKGKILNYQGLDFYRYKGNLVKTTSYLRRLFRLHDSWERIIDFFIRTNKVFMFPTGMPIFYGDLGRMGLWYAEDPFSHYQPAGAEVSPNFLIAITKKVTKKELFSFLEENWKEIEKELKEIVPLESKVGKLSQIRLAEEIVTLRNQTQDERPMTFNDIAEKLEERHPHESDPDKCYNADQVKMLYNRYLKRLKEPQT